MIEDPDPHADLKQHRMTPEMQALIASAHKVPRVPKRLQKRQQHFVKVPWPWIECLQGVKTSRTYRLALMLLYLHWKGRGAPIRLANGMLGLDGISRNSKWRALADLERLGLIVVERRPSKSPIVRLNLSHL